MIVANGSGNTPRQIHVDVSGTYLITDYIRDQNPAGSQAFLVHDVRHPGYIAPHFHKVQQFQVIVSSGVRLGKKLVPPVSIQYADPFTPYGPIAPGVEEPLAFFTLRAEKSDGIFFMPGSRDQMSQKAGRNIAVTVPARDSQSDGTIDTLIEPHADGLAAFSLHLPPGESLGAVPSPGRGPRFLLVSEGSLVDPEQEFPRYSVAYLEAHEEPAALTAGPNGAHVLVMQFPEQPNPAIA